jgi:hypothetical protein
MVVTVPVLDSESISNKVLTKLLSDFRWVWITRSMIGLIGPYGDGKVS